MVPGAVLDDFEGDFNRDELFPFENASDGVDCVHGQFGQVSERALADVSAHPSQLVLRVESLEEALSGTLAMERFYSILLGLFAAVALTLAASGIYGVFAYWVRQRRREMGLRIALGASPSEVRRLVLSRAVAVTVPSLGVGLGTALALSKALSSTFRGIDTVDPAVLATAAVALACVAMAACIVPARQAAKVQPTVALRSE